MKRLLFALLTCLALLGSGVVGHTQLRGIVPDAVPGNVTFETETAAWAAQVVTNGGAVSYRQEYYVNKYILALKNASLWTAGIDDVWLLSAENEIQALTSLKGLRLATNVASMGFIAKQGYKSNGTSSYINSGFNFSTMHSNCTSTTCGLDVYELENVNTNTTSAGTQDATNTTEIFIKARNSAVAQGTLMSNTTNATVTNSDSRGMISVERTAGPVWTMYKNGSSLGALTPTANGTTFPASTMYLGAYNNNGTAANFRASRLAAVVVRAGGNTATYYAALQAFMVAMGCNQ